MKRSIAAWREMQPGFVSQRCNAETIFNVVADAKGDIAQLCDGSTRAITEIDAALTPLMGALDEMGALGDWPMTEDTTRRLLERIRGAATGLQMVMT